jgi:hypothetical protein
LRSVANRPLTLCFLMLFKVELLLEIWHSQMVGSKFFKIVRVEVIGRVREHFEAYNTKRNGLRHPSWFLLIEKLIIVAIALD